MHTDLPTTFPNQLVYDASLLLRQARQPRLYRADLYTSSVRFRHAVNCDECMGQRCSLFVPSPYFWASTGSCLQFQQYRTTKSASNSDARITIGALIRGSWATPSKTDPDWNDRDDSDETKDVKWQAILFQLSPVHRVFPCREGRWNEYPVLQEHGVALRYKMGECYKNEVEPRGIMRLLVGKKMDEAVLEAGRWDGPVNFEGAPMGAACWWGCHGGSSENENR